MDIGLPVLNEVRTPLLVIGAEGSVPSFCGTAEASGARHNQQIIVNKQISI